jgi:undecaprenyl-diphosphatase
VLALILCGAHRRWGTLWLTWIAIALADWSAAAIKALVDRPRPFERYAEPKTLVPHPHDASFPSGHAATSFAAATMLSLAFPSLAAPLLVLATAVSFSRVYVGVHYPLDILGGAVLGALVAIALRRLVRARRR